MKFLVWGVVLAITLFGIFLFTGKSNGPKLSMQTIQADIASGAVLVDVRTPAEFAAGHIEGAVNLPLQNIQAGAVPVKDKSATVYVYCHSGNRSTQATALLKKEGYSSIVNLGAMTHVQSIGGVVKS